MVTHYFTLHALSRELDVLLAGARITEVFSQQKNELLIGLEKSGRTPCLCISIDPVLNYCFLRETYSRARRNSVDLFAPASGATITGVSLAPYDRRIDIALREGFLLHALLYNTSQSNVFLTDRAGVVLEAFKHSKEHAGRPFAGAEEAFNAAVVADFDSFREALGRQSHDSLYPVLKRTVPVLGSTFAREALHRAHLAEKVHPRQVGLEDLRTLFGTVQVLFADLQAPHPTLYIRGETPRVFSVVPLEHLKGSSAETFPSVNEAVRSVVIQHFRSGNIDADKKTLMDKLKSSLERARRAMEHVEAEVRDEERWKEYELIGKIIMANLQHLTKGTKAVDLPDIFDEAKNYHIVLNPKLTPAQNAEQYFEKGKNAKVARDEDEARLGELGRSAATTEKLLLHLDNCTTTEQIAEFKKEHAEVLTAMKILSGKKGADQPPFRIFTVAGGFEVWVGKSSANNDLLTMKYAKPNDLWFHVRGAGGSHTVLKIAGGSAKPSRETIRQAAAIAAYYSKMRKASQVPVAYCERKYVRKPKGLKEGAVTLEREQVVFVNPGLP
jgi:predicted ribosome quality control (RQC) complex YloA/Tae2 family protein